MSIKKSEEIEITNQFTVTFIFYTILFKNILNVKKKKKNIQYKINNVTTHFQMPIHNLIYTTINIMEISLLCVV